MLPAKTKKNNQSVFELKPSAHSTLKICLCTTEQELQLPFRIKITKNRISEYLCVAMTPILQTSTTCVGGRKRDRRDQLKRNEDLGTCERN